MRMARRGGPTREPSDHGAGRADDPGPAEEEDYDYEPAEQDQTRAWPVPPYRTERPGQQAGTFRDQGVLRTAGTSDADAPDGVPDELPPGPARSHQGYGATDWDFPSGTGYQPADQYAEPSPPPAPARRAGPRYEDRTPYGGYGGGRQNGRPTPTARRQDWPQYGPQSAAAQPRPRHRAGYGELSPLQARPQPMWMVLLFAGLVAAGVTILLILIFSLVAVRGASAIGHTPAGATVAPAITLAGARQALAGYASANNEVNRSRSDKDLAKIETGSSYTLDAGQYRWLRSNDPGNRAYAPLALKHPAYYIPMLPRAAYPRWFAVYVSYLATGGENTGAHGSGYIVFTQAAPGGPWLNALEPYAVPGASPAPQVALDASGYATAVSPLATGLVAQPAGIPASTAAVLSGSGKGVTVPGTLTDQKDAAFWRRTLPSGSSVSVAHSADAGAVYALRTVGGGALILFSGTAVLRLVPPAGETFQIIVPGYYSGKDALKSAVLGYAEQFSVVDPPRGQGPLRAVADVSGLDARL
jgi:hypothetical protein